MITIALSHNMADHCQGLSHDESASDPDETPSIPPSLRGYPDLTPSSVLCDMPKDNPNLAAYRGDDDTPPVQQPAEWDDLQIFFARSDGPDPSFKFIPLVD